MHLPVHAWLCNCCVAERNCAFPLFSASEATAICVWDSISSWSACLADVLQAATGTLSWLWMVLQKTPVVVLCDIIYKEVAATHQPAQSRHGSLHEEMPVLVVVAALMVLPKHTRW
jgi:hypothetical protein